MPIDTATARLLDRAALAFDTPDFIPHDPVQFPRRYTLPQDAEVAALLCATIAWGRRTLILRDAERMLRKMGDSPYAHVTRGDLGVWAEGNVHRTFFEPDVLHYLKGLRRVYERHETLNDFFRHKGCAHAWDVAAALAEELTAANGQPNAKCLPAKAATSALKRVNLALRWMVRADGVVDIGLWDFISPAQLYVPLDVHVVATARSLRLLTRRGVDRKAAEELTDRLRQLRPQDPVYYDFALFGIGLRQGAEWSAR